MWILIHLQLYLDSILHVDLKYTLRFKFYELKLDFNELPKL